MHPLGDAQRRDLLEIMEDRYGCRSTVVTSQLPVDTWHDAIGDATLADALLGAPGVKGRRSGTRVQPCRLPRRRRRGRIPRIACTFCHLPFEAGFPAHSL